MEKNYNLYVDLDGVLTNFNKGYQDLTGVDLSKESYEDEEIWKQIDSAGCDFWINLEWTNDGKKLWNYIEKYEPQILSSPSKKDSSRVGKHKWVNRELPGTHLILRSAGNKKEFASTNSILIDDREKNINDWKMSGGIGILHTSADDTIKELKELGL